MYKQVQTDSKIILNGSKSFVSPIATLKDEYGGICQIIKDDHCYVICLKGENNYYSPTSYIFKEVFEVLKYLPIPT
ncbi:hypothetical protein EMA8858_04161 [Emticicia aquatica]|uniref:Uncharacterized protein n=1 Tax=Emticicia aquatica TaxID=1681835 RepID=A0ABM9AVL3_9BACT|nr:hypothetical protein [Emticicia aquatica]CAH0998026.1 hypothetical protein EMA8858_04161 [Emticicia aquatica]